ncbi:hypothetical protein Ae406Ps2_6215c [Pseudonocardia sp. Ae406_Ps2]|nr:hypothetical protein Ae406Ps2_6215c [Pseudonocardia sp. Ae406_Ps2]
MKGAAGAGTAITTGKEAPWEIQARRSPPRRPALDPGCEVHKACEAREGGQSFQTGGQLIPA